MISHGLWQRRFGGSADVVGRTLTLDRVAFTIVGVAPRSFFGPDVGRTFDVIVPLSTEPLVRGSESVLESVVLVIAAALLVSTFVALTTRPLGFERGVLVVNMDTQQVATDPGDRARLYEETRDAVRVLPGVMAAAISLNTPLVLGPLTIVPLAGVSADVPLAAGARNPHVNVISPGWFVTYGIRLAAGREFTDRDRAGAPRVVVVNEALPGDSSPARAPSGRRLRWPSEGRGGIDASERTSHWFASSDAGGEHHRRSGRSEPGDRTDGSTTCR